MEEGIHPKAPSSIGPAKQPAKALQHKACTQFLVWKCCRATHFRCHVLQNQVSANDSRAVLSTAGFRTQAFLGPPATSASSRI